MQSASGADATFISTRSMYTWHVLLHDMLAQSTIGWDDRMREKLLKTSVQLPAAVLREMALAGLSQSEALRLAVERGYYLSCQKSDEPAALAEHYMPILVKALEDLDYGDYKLATRSLPDIVAGFVAEA